MICRDVQRLATMAFTKAFSLWQEVGNILPVEKQGLLKYIQNQYNAAMRNSKVGKHCKPWGNKN